MSKIHVATREGQSEHEETELRRLWNEGGLPRDAKYWKEGMTDWQPLESWLSTSAASFNPYASTLHAEPQQIAPHGSYAYTQSPRTLTRVVLVMLSLCFVTELIQIGSDAMQLSLLNSPFTEEEGVANDARQSIIAVSWLVLYIATSIPFLMWVRRANVNVRGFGARDLEYTPGWAVGWFFIPFLNLVRPYQAMKQLWQASHDPENWQSQDNTALVGWWWAFWVLSNISGQISFRISQGATDVDSLISSTGFSMVSSTIGVILTPLAFLLVRRISRKQEELVNGDGLAQQSSPAAY